MLVVALIALAVALGFGVLWFLARRQVAELRSELEQRNQELVSLGSELESTKETLASSRSRVEQQEKRIGDLDAQVAKLIVERDETAHALHKRTELADAQAMQIDVLSAERDDVQERLAASELRIEALSARPGAMVGQIEGDEDSTTLWDLEVTRTERLWRTSVATNPTDPVTPFADSDDPVRTAVEIEAAALREDVGAIIAVDWKASVISEPARRLVVLRVAQELLAEAAKAPGASRLVVREADETSETGETIDLTDSDQPDAGDTAANTKAVGSLVLTFEPAGETEKVTGGIPTQVTEALRN